MRKVFFRKSSVFLSIAVLVASGFLMFAGTASASDQLPYITSSGHNLYISPVDNSTSALWGCNGTVIGAGAQSYTNGFNNTAAIMAGCPTEGIAADVCTDLNDSNFDGYNGWYLPAATQLTTIFAEIAAGRLNKGAYAGTWANFGSTNFYWSSSEQSANYAAVVMPRDGSSGYGKGGGGPYVRCVRSSANPVYTVTYNNNGSNGGTVPTDPLAYETDFTVTALGNTGSLVKTDYVFSGWNTLANGSGATYAPTDTFAMGSTNVILYAKWVGTAYAITDGTMTRVSGDTTSTVDIATSPAEEGATVTLTVAPKTGMQLQTGTLVASYNDGSAKTLTLSGSGPYTFTMPAYAVTITATFEVVPSCTVNNDGSVTGIYGGATYTGTNRCADASNFITYSCGSDLSINGGVVGTVSACGGGCSSNICLAEPPTYAVTDGTMTRVSGDTTSTVNVNSTPVAAGATVTLTVVPKAGMRLQAGTLVASYNDGSPKTLTLSGSGPYTFTMPAYAVTVTATFEATPVNITSFDAITDIAGGIVGSATYANVAAVTAALPESATANSGAVIVPVATWVDTDSYNPAAAGTYSFTATLGTIPEGFTNTGNHTATVDVILTAPEDDNEPTNIGPTAEKFAQDIESGFITVQGDNPAATKKITFNESYTIINGDSRVVIPAGTEMTNSESGTMDLTEMTLEDITDSIRSASVGTIAGAVSVGIPDLKLSFSHNITVTIPVGSSYNGQTLNVYYQNEGEDNWNSGLTCTVADGLCVFQTNHATEYSAGDEPISGSGDTEDKPDRAKDISWKAEKYTDSNKSCSERLKLIIKGKNFDKDAEVRIGGKEASAVNVKNSKKLTAKFCLKKLLNDKVDQKRKITVKNPDTKKGEANKQIDLRDLTSGNEVAVANNTSAQSSSGGDYDQKTKEGAKQIQEALNKLGYLDAENITSTFGSITMEAVKKFQSDNGIDATGFVGELTRAKLAEKIR